jgi:hypothetical protein
LLDPNGPQENGQNGDATKSTIRINYFGMIRQNTGENWGVSAKTPKKFHATNLNFFI